MAIAKVSEHDVNALLASGKLAVSGSHGWKKGDNKYWSKIVIPVEAEVKSPSLRICVSVNLKEPSHRNFVLLWNNSIRVRCLCVEGSHPNPHTNTERWLRQTHKHKWTDRCQDRFAYTPADITATEIQGQLEQFCTECGIACSAAIPSVPAPQKDLTDDL